MRIWQHERRHYNPAQKAAPDGTGPVDLINDPAAVQRFVFPVMAGRTLGKYGKYADAP